MTYTVFTCGQIGCDQNFDDNYSQTLYAVLENRLTHDKHGLTQLNPYIQSDIFTSACGCYSETCIANTTSIWNANCYFSNNCITYTLPYCVYCSMCSKLCCGWVCLAQDLNRYWICSCSGDNSPPVSCITYCIERCAGTLCLCDYDSISINASRVISYTLQMCNNSLVQGSWLFNFDGQCSLYTYCCCNTSGGVYTYNTSCGIYTCICYKKASANCYDIYLNGVCTGQSAGNSEKTFYVCDLMKTGCGSGSNYLVQNFCVNLIKYKYISGTFLNTNIKNYSTAKNAVMLVTDSTIPTGNCIRYNIKNQAGTVLLCNGCADSIQQLTAGTSCCFYAEIYQCTECSLCIPQCMKQYALIFM